MLEYIYNGHSIAYDPISRVRKRDLMTNKVHQYTARTKPMIGRTFYGHAQFMYKYKNWAK